VNQASRSRRDEGRVRRKKKVSSEKSARAGEETSSGGKKTTELQKKKAQKDHFMDIVQVQKVERKRQNDCRQDVFTNPIAREIRKKRKE